MNILFVLHGYPPTHNAGAEMMAHGINRWLINRGHTVTVVCSSSDLDWEGVIVHRLNRSLDRHVQDADVVFTHLDATPVAEDTARRNHKPLVHVLHNDRQLTFHNVTYAQLIVANSNWIAQSVPTQFAATPQVVVYPPTFTGGYTTDSPTRDSVTLVNLFAPKGPALFFDLATRMPNRQFLAVTGGYGRQEPAPQLPNLTVVPNHVDMGPVWDRTRILVCPSTYESFGKAAAEAMASGIPVVAHPTPGLLESLGSAGIFADRKKPGEWVEAITNLDDPTTYRSVALAVRERAVRLETVTRQQLVDLEGALAQL